jgi:hypothetical protein
MAYTNSIQNFGTTVLIVSKVPGQGNYTTIQDAANAALTGQTIFLCDGTYSEDVTFPTTVSITAYTSDALSASVVVTGVWTISSSDNLTVSVSNIQFLANVLGYNIIVSGTGNVKLYLTSCNLISVVQGTIQFTNSNAVSQVNLYTCRGNITDPSVNMFDMDSPGTINIYGCSFVNSGNSVQNNVFSNGNLNIYNSVMQMTFALSDIVANIAYTILQTNTAPCLTVNNTSTINLSYCKLINPDAGIDIADAGGFVDCNMCSINTNAVTAITGLGTLAYNVLASDSTNPIGIAGTITQSLHPTLVAT